MDKETINTFLELIILAIWLFGAQALRWFREKAGGSSLPSEVEEKQVEPFDKVEEASRVDPDSTVPVPREIEEFTPTELPSSIDSIATLGTMEELLETHASQTNEYEEIQRLLEQYDRRNQDRPTSRRTSEMTGRLPQNLYDRGGLLSMNPASNRQELVDAFLLNEIIRPRRNLRHPRFLRPSDRGLRPYLLG